jgi:RNA polymerase sigma-70 factor (ECF subfamily)
MATDPSFDDLIARLRAGDPQAAAMVFNRYTFRLVALARSRLDGRIRSKVDAEDVVQSVYRSFFTRHAAGEFAINDAESLWGMLALITARKASNRVRSFRSARRDTGREVPLLDRVGARPSTGWELPDREPSPEEAAMLVEAVETLMRRLDERDQTVFQLAWDGQTTAAISRQLGRSERTIRRALERVKDEIERLQNPESSSD